MPIDAVVVNASPLIALFRSGQADLLPRLFQRVVVPDAVWDEVIAGGHRDVAAQNLAVQTWALRDVVPVSQPVSAWNLGAGETSVLSYALAHPPLRAMIDDADARRCARTLHPVLGHGRRAGAREAPRTDRVRVWRRAKGNPKGCETRACGCRMIWSDF